MDDIARRVIDDCFAPSDGRAAASYLNVDAVVAAARAAVAQVRAAAPIDAPAVVVAA